jgi:superfamily II DNA or RNA helicase
MILRKHQQQFNNTIDGIINGSKVRTIYCHCTPGSGKSLLPVIAGKLIEVGLADKLMWAAPRLSLLEQGEREFINPVWCEAFGHQLNVRSSTNEINPSRGLGGFCTTLQAVGLDEGILRDEFQRYRYILIIDEGHHIAVDSLWEKKFTELWEMASYRIFLSGTLERGDDSRIAFIPYRGNGRVAIPYLQTGEKTAVIQYTRTDALEEKAIIPLAFHLSDGHAEWEDKRGRTVRVSSLDKMSEEDANKALYTALKTEYADDLLSHGIAHWQEHRQKYKSAKCIVVTSNITEAKRHIARLGNISARCDIATSDDSATALKVINKMKAGKLDVLVSVAMCYEGLNIPEISHIICLTRIRSVPWIDQMCARANRLDPAAGSYDEQIGHIFAPADPLFKQVMARIEKEQLPILQLRNSSRPWSREVGEDSGGFRLELAPGGIKPLSSAMTGKREMLLGQKEVPEKTSSEIEKDLLGQIENHIRLYAFNNRMNPKRLNSEVYQSMGKKRREMTIPELEKCLAHILQIYPLSFVRGTGKSRVSTKAVPFDCTWRQ